MSAWGQSRRFDSAPRTSALLRSADIADRVRQVRNVPLADVDCARVVLFFLRTLFARPVLDDLNDT